MVGWIVLPLSCGILGDWTRPLNPFRALAQLADTPTLRRILLGSEQRLTWAPAVRSCPADLVVVDRQDTTLGLW